MENHPGWQPYHVPKCRQPLGYFQGKVWIVGHYLCASGGADTLRPLDYIAEVIEQQAQTYHVLFESLLWSWETRRTIQLAQDFDIRILGIDIPLEQCLEAINQRRRLKDPDAGPVNPKQTTDKARSVKLALRKLKENNKASVCQGSREQVAAQWEQWLGPEVQK
jgi:hypothetical protein